MDLARPRLTPDFTFVCFWWRHELLQSCGICVYRLWFVFFPWGVPQLQSDWSLSCDHADLIMRVNVRTTTAPAVGSFFNKDNRAAS